MFRNGIILFSFAAMTAACSSSTTLNVNVNSNSNSNTAREIKLDPANMPPGLSGNPVPLNGNLPPGISINATVPPSGKTTPGIPSAEQLKKGFKPGKASTPGIPDPETIRKQMGYPTTNANLPAPNVPMMKKK
jgi:hypothetical protein